MIKNKSEKFDKKLFSRIIVYLYDNQINIRLKKTKTSFIVDIQMVKFNIFLDAFALNFISTTHSA